MWNQIFNIKLEKTDGTTQDIGILETREEQAIDDTQAMTRVMSELVINKDLMVYQWRGKVIPMALFAGFEVTLTAAWSD